MTIKTAYDAYQKAFTLSLMSNLCVRMAGSPEALQQQLVNELQAYFSDAGMQANIGRWQVVWGPAIWQNPDNGSKVIENAMYVAHCPEVRFPDGAVRDTYVVAVMATNSASTYAWFQEDFKVYQAVKFDGYDPRVAPPQQASPNAKEPFISMATATGLYHLVCDLVPPGDTPGHGSNIVDFVQGLPGGKNAALLVVGHSLAGALAPTLALWLENIGAIGQFKTTHVYASAGATPGNAAFSLAYRRAFPPTSADKTTYKGWNRMVWNSLDVVPHAWHVSDLAEVDTLYGNEPIKELSAAMKIAMADSLASGMDYTRLPNSRLEGSLCTTNEHAPEGQQDLVVPPTTLQEFAAQAFGYQHVYAYQDMIGIALPDLGVPLLPGVTRTKQPGT